MPFRSLARRVRNIERKLTHMATQDEVDTITTKVTEVANDLATAKTTLQAELNELAANPAIDLTALQAAVEPLDQAAKDLAVLRPA